MGYLICGKCKSYHKLQSGESAKGFVDFCDCGGKLRYIENLDIVDPSWKQVSIQKKSTKREILRNKIQSVFSVRNLNLKTRLVQFGNNIKTPLAQFGITTDTEFTTPKIGIIIITLIMVGKPAL
jgi:hypothetical protein